MTAQQQAVCEQADELAIELTEYLARRYGETAIDAVVTALLVVAMRTTMVADVIVPHGMTVRRHVWLTVVDLVTRKTWRTRHAPQPATQH